MKPGKPPATGCKSYWKTGDRSAKRTAHVHGPFLRHTPAHSGKPSPAPSDVIPDLIGDPFISRAAVKTDHTAHQEAQAPNREDRSGNL